MSQAPGRTFD
jgi:hypothetical protein